MLNEAIVQILGDCLIFFDVNTKFLRKKSVIIFVYVPKMCKFAKIWFQKMAKNHIFGR